MRAAILPSVIVGAAALCACTSLYHPLPRHWDGNGDDGAAAEAWDARDEAAPPADGEAEGGFPDVPVEDGEDDGRADATDAAEEEAGCPPDDADRLSIDIQGVVSVLGGATADGAFVAALAPLDAMGNPNPAPLAVGTAGAGGAFALPCVNVKNVALGLVVLVDDPPRDGTAGTLFPTGTGVGTWLTDDEKGDIPDARAFAVTTALEETFERIGGFTDEDAHGFIMGIVTEAWSGLPVDAAVVRCNSCTTQPTVLYPNAALTGLETDGTTSAGGVFLVYKTGGITLSTFTAERSGYTFGTFSGASKSGFCFFIRLLGDAD